MKKIVCSIAILILSANAVFAEWALIELDELVAKADLIVIGTLHRAEEDAHGLGKGYISVDEIVSGQAKTLEGRPLAVGDKLKITWADNWACAAGMHMGRRGKQGIWLLDVGNMGWVTAAYPGKFETLQNLDRIRKLLRRKKLASVTVETEISPVGEAPGPQGYDGRADIEVTDTVVDVSPWPDYSLERGAVAVLISFGLYMFLYRSRFRIRYRH